MIHRRHILLVILLVILLLSKLPNLEHLKPAFVSKHFRAELDHLAVDCVVRWYVVDQSGIPRLDICYHLHVTLDSLSQLAVIKGQVLHRRLKVVALLVPHTPRSFLSLLDEVLQVVVGPITKHLQKIQLSLGLHIRLDLKPLCTVNHILSHAHLQTILNNVIVEAPRVKISLLCNLISNPRLHLSQLLLLISILKALVKRGILASSLNEDLLVVEIDV